MGYHPTVKRPLRPAAPGGHAHASRGGRGGRPRSSGLAIPASLLRETGVDPDAAAADGALPRNSKQARQARRKAAHTAAAAAAAAAAPSSLSASTPAPASSRKRKAETGPGGIPANHPNAKFFAHLARQGLIPDASGTVRDAAAADLPSRDELLAEERYYRKMLGLRPKSKATKLMGGSGLENDAMADITEGLDDLVDELESAQKTKKPASGSDDDDESDGGASDASLSHSDAADVDAEEDDEDSVSGEDGLDDLLNGFDDADNGLSHDDEDEDDGSAVSSSTVGDDRVEKDAADTDAEVDPVAALFGGKAPSDRSAKYVPPSARRQQQDAESAHDASASDGVVAAVEDLRPVETAQSKAIRKAVRANLNKLGDSNMATLATALRGVYETYPRAEVHRAFLDTLFAFIVEPAVPHMSLMLTWAAFVKAVSFEVGPELATMAIEESVERLEAECDDYRRQSRGAAARPSSKAGGVVLDAEEANRKRYHNYLLFTIALYRFGLVRGPLVQDLALAALQRDDHVAQDDETDYGVALHILREAGPALRNEDKAASAAFFGAVADAVSVREAAYRSLSGTDTSAPPRSSRARFLADAIDAAATQLAQPQHRRKGRDEGADLGNAAAGSNALQFQALERYLVHASSQIASKLVEPLSIRLDDLRHAATRGRWWRVGGAWGGRGQHDQQGQATMATVPTHGGKTVEHGAVRVHESEAGRVLVDKDGEFGPVVDLMDLASRQRLTSSVKKDIFVIIMGSEDVAEARERLDRLRLKSAQQREVMRVLVHCCLQEQSYNPYYGFLASKLARHDRGHQLTLQYVAWEECRKWRELAGPEVSLSQAGKHVTKAVHRQQLTRVAQLAELYAQLLVKVALPITFLKGIDFLLLGLYEKLFIQVLLCQASVKCATSASAAAGKAAPGKSAGSSALSSMKKVFGRLSEKPHQALLLGITLFLDQHIMEPLSQRKPVVGLAEADVPAIKLAVGYLKSL
ncbi:hypothetical protein CXG81DRAFT_28467 [Caulochytrium protostelioides]|uniref:MI domain-containing protein n=1 Tax=Caulochytrium protostelioides TaxID=1555241 RepID=A0A4P9X063_9FUNG|nr:hypothetical protein CAUPRSCDRAFT_10358 [Caulochytrium protostelioides]RKO98735.1 hypothetical protein CXG81DRAFT_28467 [Caulochytrium protostelioides]|eukprot:RKO98735.1 hypothetical protein CXG81DRAFT_28467 [Caulochytrium protostelioides]